MEAPETTPATSPEPAAAPSITAPEPAPAAPQPDATPAPAPTAAPQTAPEPAEVRDEALKVVHARREKQEGAEPAPKPAEPPKATPAPAAPVSRISADLLRDVVDIGMRKEFAESFADDASLLQYIAEIAGQQQPMPPAPAAVPGKPDDEWPEFKDEEDADEKWHPLIPKFASRTKTEIDRLTSRLAAMEDFAARQQRVADRQAMEEHDARMDRTFAQFEKDDMTKGLFGAGTIRDVPRDSKEFQNRLRFDTALRRQIMGHQSVGEPLPAWDKLCSEALRAEFFDELAQAKEKQLANSLNERQALITSRPIGKSTGTSGMDVREEAVAKVRARRAKQGR